MGETLKQQHAGTTDVSTDDTVGYLSHDYALFLLVLGLLAIFYFVIMNIVSGSWADRTERLNKLKSVSF